MIVPIVFWLILIQGGPMAVLIAKMLRYSVGV